MLPEGCSVETFLGIQWSIQEIWNIFRFLVVVTKAQWYGVRVKDQNDEDVDMDMEDMKDIEDESYF